MDENKLDNNEFMADVQGTPIDIASPDDTGAVGWRYDSANHLIVIFTPAIYTLTGSTSENKLLIQPESPTQNPFQVILQGITISKSGDADKSAITIKGGAYCMLQLDQVSYLHSGNSAAGVNVFHDSVLEIGVLQESNAGLEVYPGIHAAAIGANEGEAYGRITINSGYLSLYPTDLGAGLGYDDTEALLQDDVGAIQINGGSIAIYPYSGSPNGINCKYLEITGGKLETGQDWSGSGIALRSKKQEDCEIIISGSAEVIAQGGYGCPGIDCYVPEARGKITINGGVVTAYGGEGAAGIGNGYYPQDYESTIIINDGVVCAYGRGGGAGIGGGNNRSSGNIELNGGIICAYGSGGSAAIGGGASGRAGDILISDKASIIADSQDEYVEDIGSGYGRLIYTGLYSGFFDGEFSGIYQGRLSGLFNGKIARDYTKTIYCNISGDYNEQASGEYSGFFAGRYSGSLLPKSYEDFYKGIVTE